MLPRAKRCRAVTRVETMVIAAIVLLLVTVGAAVLSYVREEARSEACSSLLARYGEAFAAYVADHGNTLPYENVGDEALGRKVWYDVMSPYMVATQRVCPSVDRSHENYREGYRMNSKLAKSGGSPPMPYRKLDTLDRPDVTAILFDAQYGGPKLSLKGKLDDVAYRHNGSANVLFADWRVERFSRERLRQDSKWLPPKIVWDPDAGMPLMPESPEKKGKASATRRKP